MRIPLPKILMYCIWRENKGHQVSNQILSEKDSKSSANMYSSAPLALIDDC